MGKSNAAMKEYVGRKERFADLFNYFLFQGELVIRPEDLEPVDGESDIIINDKGEKEQEIHRYRDITMRWKYGCNFTILACENQQKVHYAMPVRNMFYDSLSYVEQIKSLWKEKKGKKVTPEEYLSRFCKEDKLFPVITIVMYYGLEEWDASQDLYGMFQIDERFQNNQTLQQYISNYKINLIDVGNLESVEKFRTDLQIIFGMLQYRSNTESLLEYVKENEDFFRHMDKETFRAVREFLHSEKKSKKVLAEVECDEEEKVDMCKALDDLYKMGEEKGEKIGYERGKEETEQKMRGTLGEEKLLIARKLLDKLDVSSIADVITMGIALSVKSNLGVSPVSSIPYTVTCVWGIEMGKATILFHCVLVLFQAVLLRKNFEIKNLLQVIVGIVFGYFTTFCNWGVSFLPTPENIVIRLCMMLLSTVFIAFGIFWYMPANIMPLAGSI